MRDNKFNIEEKLCSSVRVTTGDKERSRVPPSIPVLDRHPTSLKPSYAQTCRRSETVDVIDEIIQGSISTFGDIEKSKLLPGNQLRLLSHAAPLSPSVQPPLLPAVLCGATSFRSLLQKAS